MRGAMPDAGAVNPRSLVTHLPLFSSNPVHVPMRVKGTLPFALPKDVPHKKALHSFESYRKLTFAHKLDKVNLKGIGT